MKIRWPTTQHMQDISALAGFCMTGYGLYILHPAAMWIICGIWLMVPPVRKGGRQ
ncbi:hypothetical protein M7775_19170 [Sporomusa sphaeroides DSM 2875]|uniref:hypothetical protein n=1 Tax=Sporomusa sphaeroides TaxID=47679 RepID=UPI00202F3285|nr:hypothetical protein [Sporomusa sphaeroides]MCM0760675.1 hypothetical protein [Sporomusa sphaeroides DSM 2875]